MNIARQVDITVELIKFSREDRRRHLCVTGHVCVFVALTVRP